jgi:magnesium transporter
LRLIPPDDLADILLHLTPERARQVEEALDAALLDEVRPLLRFDPDSAGGLMTPRYLSVPEAVSAAKAIEILRRARLGDSPSYVYVVDPGGALVGTLPLRALFLADPRASVRDLASREIVKVTSGTPRAEIVRTFGQYHYASLPVVDERDRLVGIVTADDVLAEMRRTEGRVVHGVTGADPREALKATLAGARSRVPWVTVTLLGGLGCAFIAARFQRTLEEFLVLGLFIPVVLALAESVAAQTISVALSALMGGDIPRAKLARFVAKELLIGAAVGLYAGTAVAFASLLWHGEPRLGLLIGAATGISVAWATLLGVLIPALAVRLRVNPAFASGPLVLALADLSTLGVYLGGATLLLPRGPGG